MTDEVIERLKEKVEKNPLSKFVVPLAEEYRKKGMVDEAINVLLEALENRPDYTSARVTLAKIYLHKDMLSEAREEFEQVINLIPDNLLAHKKLADIYSKQGEVDMALKEYQIILNLNPNDEEAGAMKLELEEQAKKLEPEPNAEAENFKTPSDADKQEDIKNYLEKTKDIPVYEIHDDVNASELGIEITEKLLPVPEGPVSHELKEFQKIMAKETEQPPSEEKAEDRLDTMPVAEEIVGENHHEKKDKIIISMPTETMANIFIAQGLYDKAMNIYKEILASEPENERIIQKSEELKMLIKLQDKKP